MPSSSSTNRTGLLDGTSIQEQFFGKSRLPSIRVGNDGQIPPLGNLDEKKTEQAIVEAFSFDALS